MIFNSTSLLLLFYLHFSQGELADKEHKTTKAQVAKNELSCFECDTMVDGDKCINVGLGPNKTAFLTKCHGDKRICRIRKYSYTTSTENSTSQKTLWSIQRNCSATCELGCIVIGERTKLYSCTSCCTVNGCNVGRGIGYMLSANHFLTTLIILCNYLFF